jgi:hypothetical protein
MPTRDDLVAAWGDHIVSSLRTKPRAVFVAGRFVGTEGDAAVFALPNSSHVAYAEPLVPEVADVLSSYFKRPISLRLITEDQLPGGGSTAPKAPSSEASKDASAVPSSRPATARRSAEGGLAEAARPSTPALLAPDEEEYEDVRELSPGEAAGNHDPFLWAESRLMEAFPGAEEVP